ncbi:hypothetical protein P170DRAFT_505433 [Aspergillus steynii IBT 23096]|uniref:DUF676 domain-containing protein n=1 Tax=Aspergillus steynii IBT 23096 TaxID=1392250 RepID=A0A2I2GPB3_9EURO|nr:uncharacterized protein P170DRAFT_505433 [Aspergillus steynii IBT 23096]PLB54716.1 hypothetical protein P170DRAFT_505433 [Aspergillus steynii IBT 23096]
MLPPASNPLKRWPTVHITTPLTASDLPSSTMAEAIVFVHGLRGHPRRTWEYRAGARSADRNSRLSVLKFWSKSPPSSHSASASAPAVSKSRGATGVFWPADLLPFVVPNARIFTYGYDADVIGGIFNRASPNSILRHGNDLMVRLERVMDKKPIIFVAHNLGGLVVKVAIQRCKTSPNPKHQSLYRRFDTVVFCGTPHRESEAASWGRLAHNLVAVALKDLNPNLLRDLEVDSQMLEIIHNDFRKILHAGRIRVHTFQEAQGLTVVPGLNGKVVDNLSSRIDYKLETVETINANHRDMVRFKNERNPGFRALSGAVKSYVLTINERKYAECIRKGNGYFKRRILFSFIQDRQKALRYFIQACDLLNPNDFDRQTYVYSKLMFVEIEISYYRPFPRPKQAQHLHQAHGYGLQALEKAQLLKDITKVAEIKLMLACVKAREVKLDYIMDVDDRILSRKRELIMKEIKVAMSNVRAMDPSNINEFEQWGRRAYMSLQKLNLGSLNECDGTRDVAW